MKQSVLTAISIFFLTISTYAQNQTLMGLPLDDEELSRIIGISLKNNIELKENVIETQARDIELQYLKKNWLELFSVSGNLNEFSIRELTGTSEDIVTNQFFPRYNLALNFTFGTFSEMKKSKDLVVKEVEALGVQRKQKEQEVIGKTQRLYHNYILHKERLSLKRTFQELAQASYNAKERSFRNGEISLEEYYDSKKEFSNFQIEIMEVEQDFLDAKSEIEEYVGIKFD